MSVIHSKMLYASPAGADAIRTNNRAKQKLKSVKRKEALRLTSVYKTVFKSEVLVFAIVPSLKLLVRERKEYHR